MPSKKKKYNARFPPARIKKIMQSDEDVGKVAAAVPVIISRALELFIESLILKSKKNTQEKHAKTLSTAHIKQTILSEKQYDFLKDYVSNVPDVQPAEEDEDGVSSSLESQATPKPHRTAAHKPRGRPRKNDDPEKKEPSKRGRKRKVVPPVDKDESTESDDDPLEPVDSESEHSTASLTPSTKSDFTAMRPWETGQTSTASLDPAVDVSGSPVQSVPTEPIPSGSHCDSPRPTAHPSATRHTASPLPVGTPHSSGHSSSFQSSGQPSKGRHNLGLQSSSPKPTGQPSVSQSTDSQTPSSSQVGSSGPLPFSSQPLGPSSSGLRPSGPQSMGYNPAGLPSTRHSSEAPGHQSGTQLSASPQSVRPLQPTTQAPGPQILGPMISGYPPGSHMPQHPPLGPRLSGHPSPLPHLPGHPSPGYPPSCLPIPPPHIPFAQGSPSVTSMFSPMNQMQTFSSPNLPNPRQGPVKDNGTSKLSSENPLRAPYTAGYPVPPPIPRFSPHPRVQNHEQTEVLDLSTPSTKDLSQSQVNNHWRGGVNSRSFSPQSRPSNDAPPPVAHSQLPPNSKILPQLPSTQVPPFASGLPIPPAPTRQSFFSSPRPPYFNPSHSSIHHSSDDYDK